MASSLLPLGYGVTRPAERGVRSDSRWGCGCGNVDLILDAKDEAGDEILLDQEQLIILHSELVAFRPKPSTQTENEKHRRSSSASHRRGRTGGRSTTPPSNRAQADDQDKNDNKDGEVEDDAGKVMVCLVCEVDVLEILEQAEESGEGGKGKSDSSRSKNRRVKILVQRTTLDSSNQSAPSPLFSLSYPTLSQSSTFGLPPSPAPIVDSTTYLRPSPDPFFLPPPFTPSHPYFSTLVTKSIDVLSEYRQDVEREIKRLVEEKRREVDLFEEKMRREVEVVWEAFGKAERMRGVEFGEGEEVSREVDAKASRNRHEAASPESTGTPTMATRKILSFPASLSRDSDIQQASYSPSSTTSTRYTSGTGGNQVSSPTETIQQIGVTGGFNQSSLLSASLSNNSFIGESLANQTSYLPASASSLTNTRSPRLAMSNPITQPYRASQSGVDKDLASSLRVSHMPSLEDRSSRRANLLDPDDDPAMVTKDPSPLSAVEEREEEEEKDIELNPFGESTNASERSSYQDHLLGEDDRTPRTRTVKMLSSSHQMGGAGGLGISLGEEGTQGLLERAEVTSGEGHSRKKVKFEEAVVEKDKGRMSEVVDKEEADAVKESAIETPGVEATDVFDFEDNDIPLDEQLGYNVVPDPELEFGITSPKQSRLSQGGASMVQDKLIELHAADTPSHRAAWRHNKGQLWNALGKTTVKSPSIQDSPTMSIEGGRDLPPDDDDNSLSLFASSMPINIAFRARKPSSNVELEPKTSLVERKGILVPGLKQAMRVSSKEGGPATTFGPQDIGEPLHLNRSASGSREGKERSRSNSYSLKDRDMQYPKDPGPALEAVAESGGAVDPEDVVGGATFVPPHRMGSDRKASDGGWRSMVTE